LLAGLITAACLVGFASAEEPPKPADGHAAPAAGHADASHDGHGEKGNIFDGGIGNVVWTTLIFGVVVAVLGSKAWPQVLKALRDREDSIRVSLENAKREREESQKLLAQYQRQIDEARKEATAIVEEGRRDAAETRRRLQDEARKESDEMLARAKREIQLASDTAIKELYDKTADLAVNVAGGIVRKELNADDHRRLVSESLERMKAARN